MYYSLDFWCRCYVSRYLPTIPIVVAKISVFFHHNRKGFEVKAKFLKTQTLFRSKLL